MTPQEFKAWFDGFTEAFGSEVPTAKQWARIKERVAEINDRAVTKRFFVEPITYATGDSLSAMNALGQLEAKAEL